jgi:hypothetical protein
VTSYELWVTSDKTVSCHAEPVEVLDMKYLRLIIHFFFLYPSTGVTLHSTAQDDIIQRHEESRVSYCSRCVTEK